MHLDHLPGTFFGPSNLVELLRHRARCQPEDIGFTYLVDGENQQVHLTYRELDRQARAIGAWLEGHDLVGQRALLLYPAGLEFIAAFFGCLYAGVIAVPVYPPRRNRSLNRIQAIADDAEARVALTTDLVFNRVMPLIDETPHLKQLTWLPTCQVPPGMEDQWSMPDVHGDTLAFLQYTSGSTGTPKGVVLNHANLVHNSALISLFVRAHPHGHGRVLAAELSRHGADRRHLAAALHRAAERLDVAHELPAPGRTAGCRRLRGFAAPPAADRTSPTICASAKSRRNNARPSI